MLDLGFYENSLEEKLLSFTEIRSRVKGLAP